MEWNGMDGFDLRAAVFVSTRWDEMKLYAAACMCLSRMFPEKKLQTAARNRSLPVSVDGAAGRGSSIARTRFD